MLFLPLLPGGLPPPGVAADGRLPIIPDLPTEFCELTQQDTQEQAYGLDRQKGQGGAGHARGRGEGWPDHEGKGDGGVGTRLGHYGPYANKGYSQQAPFPGHSLSDLFSEIQGINQNNDSKFNVLQIQLYDLKKEMSILRAEMVSKQQFEELETRVFKLESREISGENPDTHFLQQQLDRLDPAMCSLRLVGFSSSDVATSENSIQKFFADNLPQVANRIVTDHISKYSLSGRVLSNMCIVELPSKQIRDDILQQIKTKKLLFKDGQANIDFGFAKTKKQIRRNTCMRNAEKMLKADPLSKDKSFKIEWMIGSDKSKRQILVADEVAFKQDSGEVTGRVLAPFSHLHLE